MLIRIGYIYQYQRKYINYETKNTSSLDISTLNQFLEERIDVLDISSLSIELL